MEASTQTQSTVTSTALRYGLLTGIASIIFTFILFTTGQVGNAWLGWVSLVIPITGIILAQRSFRSLHGGFMSYGEGMGIGVLLSLVSGVLNSAFSYIYRLLDPDAVQQVVNQMRAKFEEAGTMSDAQIDQAIAMSQKFSTGPIGFVMGIIVSVIGGAILSLIITAFIKNTKPEFE